MRATAVSRRAALRFSLQDQAGALADYSELVRLQPTDSIAWISRAQTLDALERPDEALDDYERAVEVAPRLIRARLALANAYASRARLIDAITQWRSVIGLNPDNHQVRLQRLYANENSRRLQQYASSYSNQAWCYYVEWELTPDMDGSRPTTRTSMRWRRCGRSSGASNA